MAAERDRIASCRAVLIGRKAIARPLPNDALGLVPAVVVSAVNQAITIIIHTIVAVDLGRSTTAERVGAAEGICAVCVAVAVVVEAVGTIELLRETIGADAPIATRTCVAVGILTGDESVAVVVIDVIGTDLACPDTEWSESTDTVETVHVPIAVVVDEVIADLASWCTGWVAHAVRIHTVDESITILINTSSADLNTRRAGRVANAVGIRTVNESIKILVYPTGADLWCPRHAARISCAPRVQTVYKTVGIIIDAVGTRWAGRAF